MSTAARKRGFSVIELTIAIVTLGLLGYLGYVFLTRPSISTQNPVATDVESSPQIKSTADLKNAEKVLDSADLDQAGDSSLLSSNLSSF